MTKTQLVVVRNDSRTRLPFADVERVAAILDAQIANDFFPVWGIRADVVPVPARKKAPAGAWRVSIVDKQDGGGVHLYKGRPYARVKFRRDWTFMASHELLEMLADPFGTTFDHAPSIDPAANGRMVRYLREVCDPCLEFKYVSSDALKVSDFVTPEYYQHQAAGAHVDFMRKLPKPFHVPLGGYLSWIDPTDGRWHFLNTDGTFETGDRADPNVNPRQDQRANLLDLLRAGGTTRQLLD